MRYCAVVCQLRLGLTAGRARAEAETEIETETDKQTDRQTDREGGREGGRVKGRKRERERETVRREDWRDRGRGGDDCTINVPQGKNEVQLGFEVLGRAEVGEDGKEGIQCAR